MTNPGQSKRNLLTVGLIIALLIIFLALSMLFFHKENLKAGILFLLLPLGLLSVVAIFIHPIRGLIAVFVVNYFAMGIARYIPGPLGLMIDGLLVLTWIAVFFSQFNKKVEWKKSWNGLTIVAIIWYSYTLFQLINPEVVSRVAWFYAMRGISLYMLLAVPLVFLLFDNKKHLDLVLRLWAWFTILGVLKGAAQHYIGPDPWEQQWLNEIGGKTHLLPQGLRIFSFFTDAGTYGGSMGYSGVVFSIIALNAPKSRNKLFFGIVALAAFYGMIISGTRGALAVPIAGFTLYALLSRKIKMIILGGILLIAVFAFLKFSTLGSSVYEIRRLRTALEPDNPSLMVRKENQKLLKSYLASRPIGGGIGSAGNWGLRFSPDTFLAKTPTDSWYVQIWAEQGRVGLILHLVILAYILTRSVRITMFKLTSNELKGKAAALTAGMFGVMAASYGGGTLGQMPNGIIVYMSMAFIFMMQGWEEKTPE
jgi:hypothetical protein